MIREKVETTSLIYQLSHFKIKFAYQKKEFINKKISIKKTSHLTHAIYPFQIKNLENNTDHIDLENEIFGSRTFTVTLIAPTWLAIQSARADH